MPHLEPVFTELRSILAVHEAELVVTTDEPNNYQLDSHVIRNGKPLYFGGVNVAARDVRFHLMPIYLLPGLLDGTTPALRRRMQGKSCFNFATLDRDLFAELGELTSMSLAALRALG